MADSGGRVSGGSKEAKPLRGAALVIVVIIAAGLGYGMLVVMRPVYWKFYAELTHRSAAHTNTELREKLIAQMLQTEGSPQLNVQQQQQQQEQKQQPAVAAAAVGDTPQDPQPSPQQQEPAQQPPQQQQQQQAAAPVSAATHPELAGLSAAELANVTKHNITLSKPAVQALAKDGLLFLSFANAHYTDFALVWVERARRVGIDNYIVGAMDDTILVTLAKRGINTFSMKSGLTTGDFGWGTKTFAKMGRKKINLIGIFLRLGVQVAITDIDVLWLRNPTPFYDRYPEADILTSSDGLSSTVGAAEELDKYPEQGGAFNIGIMLFRSKALPMVEEWIAKIEADDKIWDQNAFNDVIRMGQVIQPDDPKHYMLGYNGTLTVGVLPVAWFSNGHVYFTQKMHKTLGTNPYCVHAIFQYSGTPGKKHRFREAMLWVDPPEYWTAQGGFLMYDPQLPAPLLNGSGPRTNDFTLNNTLGHFELIKYQLVQLRSAMALATVLGRTLILPKLWCGLDRWWAPHTSTIPGSKFDLPYQCPADHVLHLEAGMAKEDWPEPEYGPHIAFREHSFLENPSAPPSIAAGKVVVAPCGSATEAGCGDGSGPAAVAAGAVKLRAGMDSDKIKAALAGVASAPLLDFRAPQEVWGNFTQPADWTKFATRMKQYTEIWCCINAHPGHFHYDMLWDVVPHTDKFGRVWNATWVPTTGP